LTTNAFLCRGRQGHTLRTCGGDPEKDEDEQRGKGNAGDVAVVDPEEAMPLEH
jgi:hypothetical protein